MRPTKSVRAIFTTVPRRDAMPHSLSEAAQRDVLKGVWQDADCGRRIGEDIARHLIITVLYADRTYETQNVDLRIIL